MRGTKYAESREQRKPHIIKRLWLHQPLTFILPAIFILILLCGVCTAHRDIEFDEKYPPSKCVDGRPYIRMTRASGFSLPDAVQYDELPGSCKTHKPLGE